MSKTKVCVVTGATGKVGQHLLLHLVGKGYKVLAVGDTEDMFSPDVLNNRKIKTTTVLPISAKQFKKYDVQFCFGDMSDISFMTSVFQAADLGDVEIESLFHLSANRFILQHNPSAYHPEFSDTVNLLELSRAYWQSHKGIFKGFFYITDNQSKASAKIEKLIAKIKEKDDFPVMSYRAIPLKNIGVNYRGKTSLASLYRIITPYKNLTTSLAWKKQADDELTYIAALKSVADKILTAIKEGQSLQLRDE